MSNIFEFHQIRELLPPNVTILFCSGDSVNKSTQILSTLFPQTSPVDNEQQQEEKRKQEEENKQEQEKSWKRTKLG